MDNFNRICNIRQIRNSNIDLEKYKNTMLKLFDTFEYEYVYKKIKYIIEYIKNDVDESTWGELLENQKNMGRDSSSLDANIKRYGKTLGTKKYNAKLEKSTLTKDLYISRYGEKEGLKLWNEMNDKKFKNSIDWCIEKYGKEEGSKRYNEYKDKWKTTYNKNKKNRDTSIQSTNTLQHYQSKYGSKEGYLRWKRRNKRHGYKMSKQYFYDKYGTEAGDRKYYEKFGSKDHTSLDAFIKKYGKEEGLRRSNLYRKRIAYTNSFDYYCEKYGDIELAKQKYMEYRQSIISFKSKCVSNNSQKLFWSIVDKMDNSDGVYFAELNKEFVIITNNELGNCIFLDFKYKNKIIEYNGDYWHCNPDLYTAEDEMNFPNNKTMLVKEVWDRDNKRRQFLETNGYDIHIVWESNYISNPDITISECINFIGDK